MFPGVWRAILGGMKFADLRGRKRTLVAVSVVLIAFGWFLHPDSDATVGQFRSVAGRNEYVTHYWEAMRRFPTPPSVTADVDTDFGVVRVYEWYTPETRDSMPVVLIPGRSSGAPMWADNLAAFSSRHRVIAFDALGDAGLSVQAAPLGGYGRSGCVDSPGFGPAGAPWGPYCWAFLRWRHCRGLCPPLPY